MGSIVRKKSLYTAGSLNVGGLAMMLWRTVQLGWLSRKGMLRIADGRVSWKAESVLEGRNAVVQSSSYNVDVLGEDLIK